MSAQHTPGPWHFTLVKVQRDIHGQNGQPVAYTRGGGWNGIADEMDAANARLIAAAPELLETLRAVDVLFGHLAKDSTQLSWLENARAAIAKATGSAA